MPPETATSTLSPGRIMTERLKSGTEHWVRLTGLGDAAATERIRQDAIDVLVDLSGHTGGNRLPLLARRAAPIQAHYLGYFASTGLAAMVWSRSERPPAPARAVPRCLRRS